MFSNSFFVGLSRPRAPQEVIVRHSATKKSYFMKKIIWPHSKKISLKNYFLLKFWLAVTCVEYGPTHVYKTVSNKHVPMQFQIFFYNEQNFFGMLLKTDFVDALNIDSYYKLDI